MKYYLSKLPCLVMATAFASSSPILPIKKFIAFHTHHLFLCAVHFFDMLAFLHTTFLGLLFIVFLGVPV